MGKAIRHFRELEVYKLAKEVALEIHSLTKSFPAEERYSLTDQIRRSSRSVCNNLAEAWRKRRYKAAFIAKMSDSEGECAETQVSLEFSRAFKYIDDSTFFRLDDKCEHILSMLVSMIIKADAWCINDK